MQYRCNVTNPGTTPLTAHSPQNRAGTHSLPEPGACQYPLRMVLRVAFSLTRCPKQLGTTKPETWSVRFVIVSAGSVEDEGQ